MFAEDVLVEVFKAFGVVLAVVGEAVDSLLCSLIFSETAVDEGDSVLHSEEVDWCNVIIVFHI